ncbi:MAG TPA: (Fe-S)-binding protein, partial [Anaerolineae bacterium]|nr:(Fe-S)-binding protein [Anaerolineae bacterium]
MTPTVQAVAEELYLQCIRCGKCLSVCPIYRETRIESLSPRGRVALYRAVGEEGLTTDEIYANRFYNCLMCEACREICPSGVQLDVILTQVRVDLAHSGLLPEPLHRLDDVIATAGNISNEPNEQRLGWTANLETPPTGLDHEGPAEVAYFVGC